MDRRIKLRHLESFVEIARAGSLKTAAEKLFLTQPAISKSLKELEDILGASLMQRSRAGVMLTRQGDIFLHYAQMAMANLQRGFDGIEQAHLAQQRRLTIGALPSVAASVMPEVVAEFSALAPDAVLRIVDGPHPYLMDRLKLGELDAVIGRLGEPSSMGGVTFTQLYSDEVAFVVRAGHPILTAPALHRLGEWQVLYPPQGAAIRSSADRYLLSHGIAEFPNRIETVSGAFGRVYTRKTDAIWVISKGVVANEMADGHLTCLPFDMGLTKGPVGLMTRPDDGSSPLQQMFKIAMERVVKRQGLTA
ncbi:pca operon transcription factor PcaQ [Cognatishimia sp. SS12]|uniref:pca operon transcription factor PcaQ n=1 Tax=Cognatishimia sp. SS12 TaxID=2979465 RepID=UPI002FEE3FA1